MRKRLVPALVMLVIASAALAQTAASPVAKSAARNTVQPQSPSPTVAKPASGSTTKTARKTAAKGPAKKATRARHSAQDSTAKVAKETRTLQDIHIEGEIPVPQVLFITARDQRRFVDFQYQRYVKTSQEVGAQTAFPSRILVIGSQPTAQEKETRP